MLSPTLEEDGDDLGVCRSVRLIPRNRLSFVGSVEGFLGNAAACSPCASPVVDLGATLDPFSTGGGTGGIDGVSYSLVYIGFPSGTFSTGTAPLTELGVSVVEVPFTFSGVMNGYLEHPLIRPSDHSARGDGAHAGRSPAIEGSGGRQNHRPWSAVRSQARLEPDYEVRAA